MYFPYLRGKQFEIEALLETPASVYRNTLPIIEPVNIPRRKFYLALANKQIPFILIMNPFHPVSTRLSTSAIQGMIDSELTSHNSLKLGFIIDTRFNISELNLFLASNPTKGKSIIFRYNPLPADLTSILSAITSNLIDYIIFDELKTSISTQAIFSVHPKRILLTDGFQRQNKNADYPLASAFDSYFGTWRTNGWYGIGDFSTIGDQFSLGGGQVYVVTLHVSVLNNSGLEVHHFSSTFNSTIKGFSAQKFAEANNLLVNSPITISLSSNGLDIYRDLHNRGHNPQLGVAKKASIIHHTELMSNII